MSITWNGVNSDTIGVIVEKIPNRYVPTRRFSPQQVAGRNGNILLVDKAFPNVEQEYEVYLSAEAQGLPSVARACAEWLMGPDGYCRLTDSYDTTVYREAFLMGGYDLENILNKFGRCTITFSCKPQKYLLTGDTPISIPAGSTTTYTGSSVQFDGITSASITSLSTTIEPTQDLHGYANPWPAGGGANKLPNLRYVISTRVTLGQTENYTTLTIPLTAGTYTVSVTHTLANACYMYERHNDTNTSLGLTTAGGGTDSYTFTVSSDTNYSFSIYRSGGVDSDAITQFWLVSGSSAGTYTPYENICPIIGMTGLSVYVSPTQDPDDATVYNVDLSTQAGTVYHGTVDVVTGVLTVDSELEVFDTDTGAVISSALNSFNKASGSVSTVGSFTRISFSANSIDQTKYNRVSSSYSHRLCNMLPHSFAYNEASAHWYRNTVLYAFFPTALVGSTAQSVYDYLVSIKDDTPLSFWIPLTTPQTYQLSAQEIGVLTGTNHVWLSDGDVSLTVTTPLGGIVTNPTPFEARPLLTVSGVGEITVNGKSIQILESVSDFEIDCETMETEDNSKIYCMDFPELSGGENEIVGDGSITSLTVVPRWWTL